jgi:sugar phosphate isomerase/epimerase
MALTDPISFQLYSARNFPPLDRQLAMLAAEGYTNVEPYSAFYGDVGAAKRLLDVNGLKARSGHFGLDQLEREPEAVLSIAQALGMDFVIVPYIVPESRPTDRAGWVAFGQRLARAGAPVRAKGLRFGWHNHDFEFRPLPDGSFPIEHVLADDGVLWEADIAWIARGEADPRPWLRRYAGRIPLVHVKDIAPAGQKRDEDGWADVGSGTLPWQDYWDLAVASGAEVMIAEHDNPSDFGRFAHASAEAMQAMAKGGR